MGFRKFLNGLSNRFGALFSSIINRSTTSSAATSPKTASSYQADNVIIDPDEEDNASTASFTTQLLPVDHKKYVLPQRTNPTGLQIEGKVLPAQRRSSQSSQSSQGSQSSGLVLSRQNSVRRLETIADKNFLKKLPNEELSEISKELDKKIDAEIIPISKKINEAITEILRSITTMEPPVEKPSNPTERKKATEVLRNMASKFAILNDPNITEKDFFLGMLNFIESLKNDSKNAENDKLILFLTNLISTLKEKIGSTDGVEKYATLFYEVIKETNKTLADDNNMLRTGCTISSSEMLDFEKINLPEEYKLIAMVITGICMDKVNKRIEINDQAWEQSAEVKNNTLVLAKDSPNLQYLHKLYHSVGKQETLALALSSSNPIKALLSHPTSTQEPPSPTTKTSPGP